MASKFVHLSHFMVGENYCRQESASYLMMGGRHFDPKRGSQPLASRFIALQVCERNVGPRADLEGIINHLGGILVIDLEHQNESRSIA